MIRRPDPVSSLPDSACGFESPCRFRGLAWLGVGIRFHVSLAHETHCLFGPRDLQRDLEHQVEVRSKGALLLFSHDQFLNQTSQPALFPGTRPPPPPFPALSPPLLPPLFPPSSSPSPSPPPSFPHQTTNQKSNKLSCPQDFGAAGQAVASLPPTPSAEPFLQAIWRWGRGRKELEGCRHCTETT